MNSTICSKTRDLKEILSPFITLLATVSMEEKDLAKNLHYFWNQPNHPKLWTKQTKACFLDKETKAAEKAGFTIQII